MRFCYVFLLTLVSLFIASITAHAQTGRIAGTIVDGETGDPLFSASVLVVETSSGAVADFDGNYLIKGLEPGTYTLRVSYISFATQTITDVVVVDGEVTSIDVAMQSEGVNLEEVVVSAGAILNNEAGLLRQRQKSIAFSDAISAETISKSGAGDAAAAMTKVVGASVVGGKYVYVRGLGDRYSTTHLNGVELPSSDPNTKAFNLDLFPSSLLDNIVTVKTFTADRPGNFGGGLVDISTKSFPEKPILTFSTSVGFNTQVTGENVLLGQSFDNDYLGFGAKDRRAPVSARYFLNNYQPFPDAVRARFFPEVADQLDNLSKQFNNEFMPSETQASLNHGYSITLGNQFELEYGGKLGAIASFTFGEDYSGYNDGAVNRNELIGSIATEDDLYSYLSVDDRKGEKTNEWGLFTGLGYNKGSFSSDFSFLKSQSGISMGRYIEGFSELSGQDTYQTRVIEYLQRELNYYQLALRKIFPSVNAQLEGTFTITESSQEEPDIRYFTSQFHDTPDGRVYSNPTSIYAKPARYFRMLSEDALSTKVDFEKNFNLQERNGKLKLGWFYSESNRNSREQRVDIRESSQGDDLLNLVNGDEAAYFSLMGILDYDSRGRPIFGNYVINSSNERAAYTGDLITNAYYASLDLPVTSFFTLTAGLRIESYDYAVGSKDPLIEPGGFETDNYLPSITGIFTINEKTILRSSYSETVVLPNFRELAPVVTFQFVGDYLYSGNPNLSQTDITNYDLRIERYFEPGEIVSLSFFSKQLDNPLEQVIRSDLANNQISIQNVGSATVTGVEFEFRKNLSFVTQKLSNFSFSSNFTFVESSTDIPELELQVIKTADPNASSKRQLNGQSPFLINADIAYLSNDESFDASISYNYFDDRLMIVTDGANPDVFEKGRSSLNFQMSKNISDITVGFSVKNILNPRSLLYQEFKSNTFNYSDIKSGIDLSVSVKYNFF